MPDALPPLTQDLLDGVGTLAFAISGGLLGVRKRFDLFGVLFLSFVVAVTWRHHARPAGSARCRRRPWWRSTIFAIAACGGLANLFWYPRVASLATPSSLDAVGLGLFAAIGAQKALEHGIHPLMAALLACSPASAAAA